MDLFPRALARARGVFWRSERGSVTVEAVFWFPAFVLLFVMIADVSLIFNGKAQIHRIAQDANRALSVGKLDTAEDAETYIRIAAAHLSPNVTADTVDDGTLITTVVTFPSGDLDAVGLWAALTDITVVIQAQHMVEF